MEEDKGQHVDAFRNELSDLLSLPVADALCILSMERQDTALGTLQSLCEHPDSIPPETLKRPQVPSRRSSSRE